MPAGRELTRADIERVRLAVRNHQITPQELHTFLKGRNEFTKSDSVHHERLMEALLDVELEREQLITDNPENTYCYVPSHAAAILEALERVPLSKDDVVYDIGAGLGKPALLIGLLTGARVIGVEWEGKYCCRATHAAQSLNLSNVSFVHSDARNIDYSDASVLYMYTPFTNEFLDEFLLNNVWPVARKKTANHHLPRSARLSIVVQEMVGQPTQPWNDSQSRL